MFGLTRFEKALWIGSVAVITVSFSLTGWRDAATMVTSLVGVTALLFVAKGYVAGQLLTIAFAVLYGIVSFFQQYYGEMITYLGMSAPAAAVTAVVWAKHPFRGTREVTVSAMTAKKAWITVGVTAGATVAGFFLLQAIGNADLLVSTVSVATSMAASTLTVFRSPYYAIAYASNDVALIVLWSIASARDVSQLPMVACFGMFLVNDFYGFVQWKRMQSRQRDGR